MAAVARTWPGRNQETGALLNLTHGFMGPNTWSFLCCLSHVISRELGQKWNRSETWSGAHMGWQCCRQFCLTTQCWPRSLHFLRYCMEMMVSTLVVENVKWSWTVYVNCLIRNLGNWQFTNTRSPSFLMTSKLSFHFCPQPRAIWKYCQSFAGSEWCSYRELGKVWK